MTVSPLQICPQAWWNERASEFWLRDTYHYQDWLIDVNLLIFFVNWTLVFFCILYFQINATKVYPLLL